MSLSRRAEAHLREAKRHARANAKPWGRTPEWMTQDEARAYWEVKEAYSRRQRELALTALINWAYCENEKKEKALDE